MLAETHYNRLSTDVNPSIEHPPLTIPGTLANILLRATESNHDLTD